MQTLQRAPASVIAYKMGEINLVTISPKYIEIGINYELLPGEVVPYNLKLKHPPISQYSDDLITILKHRPEAISQNELNHITQSKKSASIQ